MKLLSFLILLLIAGISGAIVLAIVGFRGGILVSIAIGFIGALIGTWLSGALGLRETLAVNVGGKTFPIVWSIIGATPFVTLIGLFGGGDTTDTSNHNENRPRRNEGTKKTKISSFLRGRFSGGKA